MAWLTTSAPSSRQEPISAAGTMLSPRARLRRRAICGADSAMNAIGPTAAVASAASATPQKISQRRVGSARTPS